MGNQELDISEGTISFWITAGKVQFSDGRRIRLVEYNAPDGSVSAIKDSDDKLKFSHIYLGKGRTDVDYDISSLDPNQNHMVSATWSIESKEIILYIDGKQVAKAKIKY